MAGFFPGVFGGNKQQPTQQGAQPPVSQTAPQQPQQPQPNSTIGTQPMQNPGANPANMHQTQNNPQQDPNQNQPQGLDQFNRFFGNDAGQGQPQNNGGQPTQQTQQQANEGSRNNPANQTPTGFVKRPDPAKFKEQLGAASFTRNLDPDTVQKALSGDMNSFMDVLNNTARNVMEASMGVMYGTVEQASQGVYDRFGNEFDSRARNHQLAGQTPKHEALQHPNAKPAVKAFTTMFAQQDPSLSPAQALQMAEDYFLSISGHVQKHDQTKQQQTQVQNQGPSKEVDFSEWDS